MDIKQFLKEAVDSFYIIFFFAIVGLVVYLHILGYEFVPMRDIVGVFVASVVASLAGFVLYSSREPKRTELLIRHIIHLFAIMGISLSIATFMGWISWSVPSLVVRFAGTIFAIYIVVLAVIFYRNKRLMDKMNEKLKERYRE